MQPHFKIRYQLYYRTNQPPPPKPNPTFCWSVETVSWMTWSAAPVSSTTELCPKERESCVVVLLLLRRDKMQYKDRIHKMFVIATNIYLTFFFFFWLCINTYPNIFGLRGKLRPLNPSLHLLKNRTKKKNCRKKWNKKQTNSWQITLIQT